MKLVLVNQKLGYSSSTSYSFELCKALKARGHQIRLCTGGGELRDIFKEEKIESYLVRYNFFSFRKLIQIIAEFNPDLVHVLNLRSIAMGQKIAEHLSKPHLVSVHHVLSQRQPALNHGLLYGAIAVNEAVRESLVNDQQLSKELIRVIRSGINLERFHPGLAAPFSSDRVPVIGSIGRLEPLKGYQYLIAAARQILDRLAPSGREMMFVIVGEGEGERELRKQVKDLKLEKHVTFCPSLPDLVELIRNFDGVVVPTLRGGVGLAALEAMALAKPVIASAVGELLHLIGDGTTGLLVRERDSGAIAEKVLFLLDHPEEARHLGRQARQWVEENFSLQPMVDATEQFYQDIIEEASRP